MSARPLQLVLITLCLPSLLAAQEVAPTDDAADERPIAEIFETLEVGSRSDELVGRADSATEGTVGRDELLARPIQRAGDLVEAVPGLVLTQHSGGGKSNQLFLRGFNLDHGADFRSTVAGVPVNLPSHGHGQGYTDLNFLVPELVSGIRFRKGPYAIDQGDFTAAGSIDIDYVTRLDAGIASLAGGDLGFYRLFAADSLDLGGGATLLGAIELAESDGPWDRPDDFRRGNLVARWALPFGDAAWRLTALAYRGEWNASDQVPLRAIANGAIGRFGNLDPTLGGDTWRWSLAAERLAGGERRSSELRLWVFGYNLDLFSNFTYFLDDPEQGDQFEQVDRRNAAGALYRRAQPLPALGRDSQLVWGFDLRADAIDNGLFHTVERRRLSTTRVDEIVQLGGGPFVELRGQLADKLRGFAGVRGDLFWADVDSSLAVNSGQADAALLSPKLGLVAGPWRATEIYANLGMGFHSNDARGSTIRIDPSTGESVAQVDPLVRARALDLGVRSEAFRSWKPTLSIWALELDSELLFVGDAGTTEPSRPSRRLGIELANYFHPLPWLTLEADISLSRARFTDDDPAGDRIPGAIASVVSAAATVARGAWSAGARLRYFGPRPLTEDGVVESASSLLVNVSIARRLGPFEVGLEVFNLLDREASDIEYFYESRLPGEPADGIGDVHLHPAEPRSFRLALTRSF